MEPQRPGLAALVGAGAGDNSFHQCALTSDAMGHPLTLHIMAQSLDSMASFEYSLSDTWKSPFWVTRWHIWSAEGCELTGVGCWHFGAKVKLSASARL